MKKTKLKHSSLVAQDNSKASLPEEISNSSTKDQICDHDWQPDGQTMTGSMDVH